MKATVNASMPLVGLAPQATGTTWPATSAGVAGLAGGMEAMPTVEEMGGSADCAGTAGEGVRSGMAEGDGAADGASVAAGGVGVVVLGGSATPSPRSGARGRDGAPNGSPGRNQRARHHASQSRPATGGAAGVLAAACACIFAGTGTPISAAAAALSASRSGGVAQLSPLTPASMPGGETAPGGVAGTGHMSGSSMRAGAPSRRDAPKSWAITRDVAGAPLAAAAAVAVVGAGVAGGTSWRGRVRLVIRR